MSLPDYLAPGLRVVIAGTRRAGRPSETGHYYAGPGNKFWVLLHGSGLAPELLSPEDDERVLEFGVGLTDLERTWMTPAGAEPYFETYVDGFVAKIASSRPGALAFVSKTAATVYARAVGERAPRGYGALSWTVGGRPAFVLPGPSGANNGMPLPLRTVLWSDLADFLAAR